MDGALGPPEKMRERREDLTPMMAQYLDLCERYDDALVLFQVGDFYEAFCTAAETVARQCEITLTKREDSTGTYAMAGIPVDNAESYIERLLTVGYRIAIADQVEDPDEATGVVDRAVTRVITPGTLTEDELLTTERNNYVAAVAHDERFGIAMLDVSTGEFYATSVETRAELTDELRRFGPAECLVGPDTPTDVLPDETTHTADTHTLFDQSAARERLGTYFGEADRLLASTAERRACGALLAYAEYTRGGTADGDQLAYINHLTRYDPHEYLLLDAVAIESLELFDSRSVHSAGPTLVTVVDETASALGRRKLDAWLRRPLLSQERISARHDAVGELRDTVQVRERLNERLHDVYDIERLISRVARNRANARDLRSLADTLGVIPDLREALAETSCAKLQSLRDALDPLADIRTLIDETIQVDPPQELTEGGVINPAYDDELATLRATEREGKAWVDDLEATERERTGIDSLSVGYNSVHGYYIEVTDANLDRVPARYERRQTLKNAERYYTPELKAREDEIVRAEQRADSLEYELFCEVRSRVGSESARIQALADALAELDVLVSFGTVAAEYDYTRPSIGDTNGTVSVHIEAGRHPVVERTESSFVPNGTTLDETERLAVLTGPNMSGKSTYMRQVALIAILAQAGSFVPAQSARLPVFDRVFTRVGTSDDIAGGRSTFMVEMSELATILDNATERSLVLLDEVGRGTSSADGLAIAQAVTEHIHDEVGALTLFATHHHDLTAVADSLDGAYNLHFRTERTDEGVVFEHSVERGSADASYGVAVAATAGIDERVVARAQDLLTTKNAAIRPTDTLDDEIRQTLRDVDVARMTPLAALNTLAELQSRIEQS